MKKWLSYIFIAFGLVAVAEAVPVKIMCLGDSITQGPKGQDSYRWNLYNKLKAANISFDMVGRRIHPYGGYGANDYLHTSGWDINHEGWAGRTTAELLETVVITSTTRPDIVLLHAGTNDNTQCYMGINLPLSTTMNNMYSMLLKLRSANPRVTILLAKIIPTTNSTRNNGGRRFSWGTSWGIVHLNAALAEFAVRNSTASSRIIIVDQYTGYSASSNNISDGVHPNARGEEILASRWFEALRGVLGGVVDTQKPSMPGNIRAVAQSSSSIAISWTPSSDNIGVAGYDVYKGTTKIGTTASTNFSSTGLTANTTYSFKVQARDATGNLSDFTPLALATTSPVVEPQPDTQKPTIPGSIRAVAQSGSAIVVSWTASTDNKGVSGYDVYRGTTKVASTTALSFTNTGLAANTTYSFKVQARDAAGNLSDFSTIANATTQSGTVPPPSVVYQAESAVVVGAQKHSTYVDYINNSGDYIEWTVTVATAGTYKLGFRYAHGVSNRPLEIKVNSKVVVASLSFPGTGSTSNYQTVTSSATLTAGINKIRATAIGYSGGNMDSLTVTKP